MAHPAPGIYCLNFIPGTPKNIMAFVDISGAGSRKARVSGTAVPSALGACPAGSSDMVIATAVDEDGNVNANADLFYVSVIA